MKPIRTRVLRLVLAGLFAALGVVDFAVAPPARVAEARHVSYYNTIQPNGLFWVGHHVATDNAIIPGHLACNPGQDQYQGSGVAQVGFAHSLIQDSLHSGLAQECLHNSVYEARVTFNIDEFKKHPLAKRPDGSDVPLYAWFGYDDDFTARTQPMPRGSQGQTCVRQAFIATSNNPEAADYLWPVGEELFRVPIDKNYNGHDGPPFTSDVWSLEEAVRGWINGTIPNYGVVLTGFDERTDVADNADCLSTLVNLEMKVMVFWEIAEPELSVKDLSITDKTGVAGCASGTVTVGATVYNNSDVGAGVYDLLLKVDGQGREMLITGPVGRYGDHPDTFPPVDLSAGPHTIEVVADPDRVLAEIEEGNNSASMQVSCAVGAALPPPPKPADLQISKLEVQNANGVVGCVAGNGNNVHIVVKNNGDKEIGAVITLQAAVDGKAAGSVTMGGVGANSQKDSYISNINISRGNHTVQVTLDPENKIAEAGEGNNSASVQVNCARS